MVMIPGEDGDIEREGYAAIETPNLGEICSPACDRKVRNAVRAVAFDGLAPALAATNHRQSKEGVLPINGIFNVAVLAKVGLLPSPGRYHL